MICWVNVEELDRLKANHPKTRRRERARRVLRLVVQTREAGAPHDLPGGSELTFCPLQPSIDFLQHNLDASNPDHRLVATALQLQTTENMPVTLITEDATPRLAAIELGISAVAPPVAFRLPASDDPAEQEIRELKRQLELERHRRPKLSVHFDRTDVLTLAWPPNPIQIHGPVLKEVIAQERERFPQPSRGFRDMDPIMIPEDAKQLERRVARYFQELPGWLNKVNEHLGVSAHLQPLSFVVRNSGSAPATDVTLDLLFPTGVEVQTKATAPAPPSPPTPPDRSKQPRRLDLVQTAARALPYGTWMARTSRPSLRCANTMERGWPGSDSRRSRSCERSTPTPYGSSSVVNRTRFPSRPRCWRMNPRRISTSSCRLWSTPALYHRRSRRTTY